MADTDDAYKPDTGQGMTVAEYAAALGVSPDAIRKRVHRGTLGAATGPDGIMIVYPERDNTDADMSGRRRGPAARLATDAIEARVVAQTAHIRDLQNENARLAAQLAASESERRAMAERFDAVRWTLAEAQRLAAEARATAAALPDASHPAGPSPSERAKWRALFGRKR